MRMRTVSQWLPRFLLIAAVAGFAEQNLANEQAEKPQADKPAEAAPPPQQPATASGCLVSEAAIEDLKKQREELENQRKDFVAREADLKARESALNDELKKIKIARDELTGVQALKTKEGEERVAKLVETFETMNPKMASQVLAALDEGLAVSTMGRMTTQRLAKILNVMDASRSSRLTELLAGVVRARNSTASVGAAEATKASTTEVARLAEKNPVKGGEKENGNVNERISLNTELGSPEPATQRGPGGPEKTEGTR